MSLLMDALKKAEQAKQGLTDEQLAAEAPLALEPVARNETTATPEPPTGLPELPRLEDLDAEFLAHAHQAPASTTAQAATRVPGSGPAVQRQTATASRPVPPPAAVTRPASAAQAETAQRQAIRNAFEVKQAPPANRRFVLAVVTLSVLAIAGIGAYFWLQLRPVSGMLAQAPARPASVATALPVAAVQAPSPVGPETAATAGGAAQQAASEPAKKATGIAAVDAGDKSTRTVTAPAAPRELRLRPSSVAPPAANADDIHLVAGQSKARSSVTEGYEAYLAGNFGAAKAAYAGALQAEPRNLDALLGLAAIAEREGRITEAETLYGRILEADPRDAAAQAALFGVRAQRNLGDPVAAESRIKSLLAGQPDSAPLNFALGNVYARQARWSEAQQAYFQAMSGDAGNPDYLFNLAVSLDQLHQGKLAAQYYRQALTAADARQAGFDRGQATSRLRELQP